MRKDKMLGRLPSAPFGRASPSARFAVFAVPALLTIAGCGDPRTSYERKAETAIASAAAQPPPAEVAAAEAERVAVIEQARRIDAIRRADPALDWVHIGISTGKFSESLNSAAYKTLDECEKSSWSEANECIPIPALPDSYWAAADVE